MSADTCRRSSACKAEAYANLDIRDGHVAGVQPPPVLLIRLQHPANIQRLGLSPSTLDGTMAPLPVYAIAGHGHACTEPIYDPVSLLREQ